MYNDGNISITYSNGNLSVQCKSSTSNNIRNLKPTPKVRNTSGDDPRVQPENPIAIYAGEVKASCEGYITFPDNKQEEFEFNEEDKEIVWTGYDARDKWIKGCF